MSRSRDIANLLGAGSVILDGAPSALDTLDELAAALGDDANYASTVTTALNNRVLKTGGDTITVSSGTTVPLTIQNNGTGNSFVVNDEGSDTSPFIIDASGNMGLGTANPITKFHIAQSTGHSILLDHVSTSGYSSIQFGENGSGKSYIAHFGTSSGGGERLQLWNEGASPITFGTNNTERMRIDSSGNVGIGITPNAKLDISAPGVAPLTIRMDNYYYVNFGGNQNSSQIGLSLTLKDSSGATQTGYIYGTAGTNPLMTFMAPGSNNGILSFGNNNGSGGLNEYMRIESGGKVAVKGTATNTGPARLELQSQGDTSSFYHKEVFRVSVDSNATEITRLALSGANGFRAYFKILVTGHAGGLGNGINIKEFYWDGATNAPVQISTYTQGSSANAIPTISFNNATNNVCIVQLSSPNNAFQGTMMVEWIMPRDYSGNTGTIS